MKKGLYLEAAKKLSDVHYPFYGAPSPYCCDVLADFEINLANFRKYFDPREGNGLWFGYVDNESYSARSIALLLMHEMERTGDL